MANAQNKGSGLRERAAELRSALPPRRQGATPPEETGTVLLEFPRGESDVLRVAWNEYEGHPYLQMRVWSRDAEGGLWPTKAGVTVRLRELADFAEAVEGALVMAAEHARLGAGRRPWPPPAA